MNSRHSSIFPSISENDELNITPTPSGSSPMSPRCSLTSLSPNLYHRNSSSANYGTLPRNMKVARMSSSEERINQLTRFIILNEDVDIFNSKTVRSSSTSSTKNRKLSMDYIINILNSPSTEDNKKNTFKKSTTSLSLGIPSPSSKLKKNINSAFSIAKSDEKTDDLFNYESNQSTVSSISTIASDVTLRAEPISHKYKKKNNKKANQYVNFDLGKNDTLTYRRQRRTGVHFSPISNFQSPTADSSYA